MSEQEKWECGARRQGSAGGNDPADCDWPLCGCDPYASKVISALIESGVIKDDPPKSGIPKLRLV